MTRFPFADFLYTVRVDGEPQLSRPTIEEAIARRDRLFRASRASLIVCAWGDEGPRGRAERAGGVHRLLMTSKRESARVVALRLTRNGSPCHPLRLPRDLEPADYRP